jgi:hypothetical protein
MAYTKNVVVNREIINALCYFELSSYEQYKSIYLLLRTRYENELLYNVLNIGVLRSSYSLPCVLPVRETDNYRFPVATNETKYNLI